ncbi:hypothetical protein CTEN210_06574 [Chaetoceros tenuissimus]|uniref:G-protein coupled receptors family 1 profile domain-containing protein n=1 Tax=Chaetoceros tenuissimus TaxID=426638 RepID=A0AAD3CQM4_9STRA|nr:hypothetical protein CTEN210_06574 [Chaetoceros tenuissimus]
MFVYSVFDFMFSLAIALTTIPMPSGEDEMIYEFGGPSYGNVSTCTIQGYVILISAFGLLASASILYIYYCSSIVFKMPQEKFAKQVERPSYILTITTMVAYSLILFLKYPDMVNPTPISPYCSWDSYPHGCADNDNELVCLRGNSKDQNVLVLMILPPLTCSFLILLVSMTMILYNHSKHLKALRKARKEQSDMHCEIEESMQLAIVEEASITSKKVTSQAIAYILSFLLTWIFLVLKLALKDMNDLRSLDVLRLIFQPSQGIFHLIIFLWQKVDAVRRCNPEFSTTKILMVIICHPNELEEDRPISNLTELIELGTNSNISSALPADANLPIISSDLGFRIYKDIKIPPKLTKYRGIKEESDHEDSSFFQQQEESIDSLFLHTSLSLARIPEDVESSTGFQDLSVGEFSSLNSRSLRLKASDVDIGENDHEEEQVEKK